MLKTLMVTVAGAAIALAACSKQDTREAGSDVRAAADRVGDEAKEAANSPEMKKLGEGLKDAAGDVAHVTKEAAKGAAEGVREGAADVETGANEMNDHAKDASDKR
jgi:phosphate uptake regulator